MTDAPDLSAEAAKELRGQLICQCDDVYRHRNLHSPDCLYHLEPNLDVLVNEITRLRAERDAAWQAGAEAMREATAEWVVVYGVRDPLDIAHDIRALPIPDRAGV